MHKAEGASARVPDLDPAPEAARRADAACVPLPPPPPLRQPREWKRRDFGVFRRHDPRVRHQEPHADALDPAQQPDGALADVLPGAVSLLRVLSVSTCMHLRLLSLTACFHASLPGGVRPRRRRRVRHRLHGAAARRRPLFRARWEQDRPPLQPGVRVRVLTLRLAPLSPHVCGRQLVGQGLPVALRAAQPHVSTARVRWFG